MRLPGEQLVLDTNVLVHWMRGNEAGARLRAEYDLGNRRPRPVVPVVVAGEMRSLARQFKWGQGKRHGLGALLRALPTADISSELVLAAYADLDFESRARGRKMGKNDLWIAAVAQVLGGTVLTTDKDFDHLHPTAVRIERVDVSALVGGT